MLRQMAKGKSGNITLFWDIVETKEIFFGIINNWERWDNGFFLIINSMEQFWYKGKILKNGNYGNIVEAKEKSWNIMLLGNIVETKAK